MELNLAFGRSCRAKWNDLEGRSTARENMSHTSSRRVTDFAVTSRDIKGLLLKAELKLENWGGVCVDKARLN